MGRLVLLLLVVQGHHYGLLLQLVPGATQSSGSAGEHSVITHGNLAASGPLGLILLAGLTPRGCPTWAGNWAVMNRAPRIPGGLGAWRGWHTLLVAPLRRVLSLHGALLRAGRAHSRVQQGSPPSFLFDNSDTLGCSTLYAGTLATHGSKL